MFVVNSVDLLLSSFVYMRDVCIGLIYLIGWLRSGWVVIIWRLLADLFDFVTDCGVVACLVVICCFVCLLI